MRFGETDASWGCVLLFYKDVRSRVITLTLSCQAEVLVDLNQNVRLNTVEYG